MESDTDIIERIVSIDLRSMLSLPAAIVHRMEFMINKMNFFDILQLCVNVQIRKIRKYDDV